MHIGGFRTPLMGLEIAIFCTYISIVYQFSSILSSLKPPSGRCARRIALSEDTPLDFWSMYLLGFVNFHELYGPSKHPVLYVPAAGVFLF